MIPGSPDEQQANHHYHNLFEISSQPSWIYDIAALRFLDVNEAALEHYGYSKEEFLGMTLHDIRPQEESPALDEALTLLQNNIPRHSRQIFRHRKKNGEIIDVQIQSRQYNFDGKEARLVLVNDITAIVQSKRVR